MWTRNVDFAEGWSLQNALRWTGRVRQRCGAVGANVFLARSGNEKMLFLCPKMYRSFHERKERAWPCPRPPHVGPSQLNFQKMTANHTHLSPGRIRSTAGGRGVGSRSVWADKHPPPHPRGGVGLSLTFSLLRPHLAPGRGTRSGSSCPPPPAPSHAPRSGSTPRGAARRSSG